MTKDLLKVDKNPPACGMIVMGTPYVTLNSVDYLKDWYVTQNQFMTRNKVGTKGILPIMGKSLFCTGSEVPGLAERRKALSGTFFKQRLIAMCEIIKEMTYGYIKEL